MTQPIRIPSPKKAKAKAKPSPPGPRPRFGSGGRELPDPQQFRSLQEHLDYEDKKEAEETRQRLDDRTRRILHETEFEEGTGGMFEFDEFTHVPEPRQPDRTFLAQNPAAAFAAFAFAAVNKPAEEEKKEEEKEQEKNPADEPENNQPSGTHN